MVTLTTMPRANPITAPTAIAAPTGICLLPQPGGFEGFARESERVKRTFLVR